MKKSLIYYAFISSLVVLLFSCKKENNETYNSLTKVTWNFYLSNTIFVNGNNPPNNKYSIYHVPPNVGFYSSQRHTMQFNSNGKILYSSQSQTENYWLLLGQNIHVTKNLPDGRTFNEIWKIQELNDTLLNIKVRDRNEPENTENYWGYKYYK